MASASTLASALSSESGSGSGERACVNVSAADASSIKDSDDNDAVGGEVVEPHHHHRGDKDDYTKNEDRDEDRNNEDYYENESEGEDDKSGESDEKDQLIESHRVRNDDLPADCRQQIDTISRLASGSSEQLRQAFIDLIPMIPASIAANDVVCRLLAPSALVMVTTTLLQHFSARVQYEITGTAKC